MSRKQFHGTGVAIITPFRKDKSIDFTALGKVIDNIVDGKADYIVLMGTTGETATLTKDEKNALFSYVSEKLDARIPLVIGIGGNDTNKVVKQIQDFNFTNISGLLSVAPYYNKPSQEGIYQHYKLIANASQVPVIAYNVPGRTGVNITAETTLRLAGIKNIIAIKEASGNMQQIMQIIKNKPADFLLISGDDALTIPIIALGGCGVISVTANAFPAKFSEMTNLALKSNFEEANKINCQLLDIMNAFFEEGSPSGVKAAMTELGLIQNYVRLPLVPVSDKLQKKIAELVSAIK